MGISSKCRAVSERSRFIRLKRRSRTAQKTSTTKYHVGCTYTTSRRRGIAPTTAEGSSSGSAVSSAGRFIPSVTRVHTNPGLTVATWTPDQSTACAARTEMPETLALAEPETSFVARPQSSATELKPTNTLLSRRSNRPARGPGSLDGIVSRAGTPGLVRITRSTYRGILLAVRFVFKQSDDAHRNIGAEYQATSRLHPEACGRSIRSWHRRSVHRCPPPAQLSSAMWNSFIHTCRYSFRPSFSNWPVRMDAMG